MLLCAIHTNDSATSFERGRTKRYTTARNEPTISTPPSDAPLRLDALKVTNQQHAEVNSRSYPRPTFAAAVKGRALIFNPAIEACFGQQLIELLVEHMPHRLGKSVVITSLKRLGAVELGRLLYASNIETLHFLYAASPVRSQPDTLSFARFRLCKQLANQLR